jgi:hypothetical protein
VLTVLILTTAGAASSTNSLKSGNDELETDAGKTTINANNISFLNTKWLLIIKLGSAIENRSH